MGGRKSVSLCQQKRKNRRRKIVESGRKRKGDKTNPIEGEKNVK